MIISDEEILDKIRKIFNKEKAKYCKDIEKPYIPLPELNLEDTLKFLEHEIGCPSNLLDSYYYCPVDSRIVEAYETLINEGYDVDSWGNGCPSKDEIDQKKCWRKMAIVHIEFEKMMQDYKEKTAGQKKLLIF